MIVNSKWVKNLFLFSFCLIASIAFGQDIAFKNANFKEDKPGLKLAKESIAIADELRGNGVEKILLMQDANIIFSQAIFNYNKAQSFNPNNGELNYKIGSSYLFTNQKEKAFSYLLKQRNYLLNCLLIFHFITLRHCS